MVADMIVKGCVRTQRTIIIAVPGVLKVIQTFVAQAVCSNVYGRSLRVSVLVRVGSISTPKYKIIAGAAFMPALARKVAPPAPRFSCSVNIEPTRPEVAR